MAEVLTTPPFKKWLFYETDTCASGRTDLLVRPKEWKRDIRFGTGNLRSLYRAGSKFRKWEGGMAWIDLAQNRVRWWALVNAAINLRVPKNSGIFSTSGEPVSFSRRTLLHGVSK
jgi:hypothetical protein